MQDKIIINSPFYFDSGGAGGSGYQFKDTFIPVTQGQSSFFLQQPINISIQPLLSIGGLLQEYGTDYTISRNTLTWLNNGFELSPTDTLIIYYS